MNTAATLPVLIRTWVSLRWRLDEDKAIVVFQSLNFLDLYIHVFRGIYLRSIYINRGMQDKAIVVFQSHIEKPFLDLYIHVFRRTYWYIYIEREM